MNTKPYSRLLAAALLACALCSTVTAKPELKFRNDGSFKILMMSDIHAGATLDARTVTLADKLIDTEKPDLVILNGDSIAGYDASLKSLDLLKQGMSHVAAIAEKHHLPWVVTLGNHDTEHVPSFKFERGDAIRFYAKYPNNLNKLGPKEVSGAGNDYLLIKDSQGKKAVFNIWLLDSGMYAPEVVRNFAKSIRDTGKNDGFWEYDWIHTDQVKWYYNTSLKLEKKYKEKIPSMMCFHIPLREFRSLAAYTDTTGYKYEEDYTSSVNSAMFAAIQDRKDVKGVFCGHNHMNSYAGKWMGVMLGFDSSCTYQGYNMPDTDPRRFTSRGARVFVLSEQTPGKITTYMRYADGSTSEPLK